MMARALIALAALACFAASLLLPWESLSTLFAADPDLGWALLTELRLPRALLALIYGAMLGAAGAAIQALFANPLASPDLTGATSGAALGAVVTAYLIGLSGAFAMALGAVTGAGLSLLLLIGLAGRRADTSTLLLAGLAITSIAGALTTLALALAPSPFAFYDAYAWLMGSLTDRSLEQLAFAGIPAIIAIVWLASLAPALERLPLGEEVAESMGYSLARLRIRIVCLSALGVGACVAICGAVGFIGLVAPVFARRLTGGHPGRAILPAALIGALLLSLADLLSSLAPLGRILPIGVITALVGAPFFLWLVVRMRWRMQP